MANGGSTPPPPLSYTTLLQRKSHKTYIILPIKNWFSLKKIKTFLEKNVEKSIIKVLNLKKNNTKYKFMDFKYKYMT